MEGSRSSSSREAENGRQRPAATRVSPGTLLASLGLDLPRLELGKPVGRFDAGTPYDASDPNLALWVYASLLGTSLQVYGRFVRRLSLAHRERYYQEAKPFARLFGVGDDVLPPDYRAFRAYLARMVEGPDLAVGDDARLLAAQI